jgi:hypothetical protein
MSLRNLAKAESMNDRYAYPNTSTIDSDVHDEMFSTTKCSARLPCDRGK